ncbi:hypothetical protein ES706_02592 [subsurface metagenome]
MESFKKFYVSKTLKPNFKYVHLVLTLFLFEEHLKGFGRYKLQEELLISSGMAKSIFNKLKENNMIKKETQRKGHILSVKGKDILKKIKEKIVSIRKGNIILSKMAFGNSFYIAQIKDVFNKLTDGMAQRDASIKIKDLVDNLKIKIGKNECTIKVNNIGATCLIYEDKQLKLPEYKDRSNFIYDFSITEDIQDYLYKELSLQNKDTIIIGGSSIDIKENIEKNQKCIIEERIARLVAINSALSFFNMD